MHKYKVMLIFLISIMYPSKKDPSHGVFVKNFESNLSKEGVKFVDKAVIRGGSLNGFSHLRKYLKLYFEILIKGLLKNYNLIYVHYLTHSTFGVFFISFIRNKPVVFNIHGTDLLSKNIINRLSRKAVQVLIKLNRIKAFVVPSEYFKLKVLEYFNFSADKIIISPSGGININVFRPKMDKIQQEDLLTIGFVSRIENNKGWRLFVELIIKLKKYNIGIKAKIVGKGSEYELMKSMVESLDLNNEIEILGILNHVELAELYNTLDLFVFPTLADESLGLVGLEAMACGIPVMGSEIGGINSYLINGFNGFLFEQGNIDDLIGKTINFYKMPSHEKKELSKNALVTSQQYCNNKVTKELIKKLNNIVFHED